MNESEMPRVAAWLIIMTIMIGLVITPFCCLAQLNPSLQSNISEAITAVNGAVAAGATPQETNALVSLVNKALQLNGEAMRLPDQSEQRDALLSNADRILTNATNQANVLTTTSAQRTYTNIMVTHAIAIIAAAIGTFVYAFVAVFYDRYRVKRTLQMRIDRK